MLYGERSKGTKRNKITFTPNTYINLFYSILSEYFYNYNISKEIALRHLTKIIKCKTFLHEHSAPTQIYIKNN